MIYCNIKRKRDQIYKMRKRKPCEIIYYFTHSPVNKFLVMKISSKNSKNTIWKKKQKIIDICGEYKIFWIIRV